MKWNRVKVTRGPWFARYQCHICDQIFDYADYLHSGGVCVACGENLAFLIHRQISMRTVTETWYFLGFIPWWRRRYEIRQLPETEKECQGISERIGGGTA